ncbi:hypothetical protein JOC24_004226 [Streptomyces sp. HB132]|nr:hypothetical protein [Streptomyces sp. HB132]
MGDVLFPDVVALGVELSDARRAGLITWSGCAHRR